MKQKLLMGLTALCIGSAAFAQDKFVIGAPVPSFADKFGTYMHDAIRQYDADNEDVEITLTDANEDSARMLNDVENFIDAGVDALLVIPVEIATIKPIAKKAERAGIPLIIVNRQPDEDMFDDITAYIGSDSVEAGTLQAEEIVKQLDGKPANVAILMGQLGHEAQINRTKGVKQIFDQHDNITIVLEQEGRWDRARGLRITEDLLQRSEKINVIASNNDEMAIGALLAANKVGIKDEDIIIAGVDATPDALEYLGNGLDITIFQSAHGQAYTGAELAHKAAMGEEIEKLNFVPHELVLPQDKDEYMARYK